MKDKKHKPQHGIEAAEPRLLFSAGLEGVLAAQELAEPVTTGETAPLEQSLDTPTGQTAAPVESGLELIFVDSDTPEYQSLLDDLLAIGDYVRAGAVGEAARRRRPSSLSPRERRSRRKGRRCRRSAAKDEAGKARA